MKLTPYLIQRASFRSEINDSKSGIDSLVSFDYMGSAEFEFGALGNSYNHIKSNSKDYSLMSFRVGNKNIICLFPLLAYLDEIYPYLVGLAKGEFHLKEFSAFDSYIRGEGYFKDKFDLWWDIKNHIVFWHDNYPRHIKEADILNSFNYKGGTK